MDFSGLAAFIKDNDLKRDYSELSEEELQAYVSYFRNYDYASTVFYYLKGKQTTKKAHLITSYLMEQVDDIRLEDAIQWTYIGAVAKKGIGKVLQRKKKKGFSQKTLLREVYAIRQTLNKEYGLEISVNELELYLSHYGERG